MIKVMLGRGIKIFLFAILIAFVQCNSRTNIQSKSLLDYSISFVTPTEYFKIYDNLKDSINNWRSNDLGYYRYLGKSKAYFVDSIMCFNKRKDRFVTCILQQQLLKEGLQDDIEYILGEKIIDQWYFFSGGGTLTLPRELYQKNIHIPLSYTLLHQIALKEVYSGYLNRDGEINENWFTSKFEGNGWVNWDDTPEKIKSYTRKDYEQFHLRKVRSNWYGVKKDSLNTAAPNL